MSIKVTIVDVDHLFQNITTQDEQIFEDYMRQRPCSQCGLDHRFKPDLNDIKSSIDHASELIALFFNEDKRKNE
jgi:hypothetical protein